MKTNFEKPSLEVVRFAQNDIVTSSCECLLPELPEVTDEMTCPHDHPECMCSNDLTVNCTQT